tara:strand:- start:371 stop:865 length:495 start_codon:yes stop_codon:yes gene_type:complete
MGLLDEFHTELKTIPIRDCINWGPKNGKLNAEMDVLMESIKKHGVLQPIIVSPSGSDKKGMWDVLSGFRRVIASNNLGIEDIPALVVNKYLNNDEKNMFWMMESERNVAMNTIEIKNVVEDIYREIKTGNIGTDTKLCVERTGLPQKIVKKAINEIEKGTDLNE